MAFDIIAYENLSENNRVTKNLRQIATFSGTIKENTSIINPAIIIKCTMAQITQCNYLHIPAFGRYYFLRDVISRTASLVEVQAHADVLQSFQAQIKSNSAVITAQENDWNLYLNDGSIKVYQKTLCGTLVFPNPLNANFDYVLLVAGSQTANEPQASSGGTGDNGGDGQSVAAGE